MKVFLTIIASFVISFVSVSQEIDSVLRLEKAIEITLQNNFNIKLARNQSEIANNDNSLGNAGFLPVLDASGAFDRSIQNTEQEFINGDTQEREGASRQSLSAGLDLNWTLFDGTVMFVRKERLEKESQQAYYLYKNEVDRSLADLMNLFYAVAFEQERQKLFEGNIEFSEERLEIVRQKYEIGKESKLAFLQARVDLNADQSAAIQQRELLVATKLDLLQLMATAQHGNFVLDADTDLDSTLVLDDLLLLAFQKNPELLAEELSYEIARRQKEEIRRAALPEINANLGYNYSTLESEAGFLLSNQTSGINYGLTARVNLFNGFNRRRQIQNARISVESGSLQLDRLKTEIELQIRATYNTYSNNLNLSKIEEQNLDVALENAQIALERFRLGASDALEVREAQINAVNAQIRYLESAFNAKQAEITLKRLAGLLSGIKSD